MTKKQGFKLRPLTLAVFTALNLAPAVQAACVSLTALGNTYTQNFNTLATSGTANILAVAGWSLLETGTNANTSYAAGTGSSTTGNTYSFGASGSTDRALGGLLSSSLTPTIGACFTNNTGAAINSLAIAYTGEEWRLGTAARTDQINFQYSTSATALNNGTWTSVSALNFATPVTTTVGAKDGNAAANRTARSSTIPALAIANGASFWVRWTDTNATSSDDGLAVDDFSLTPTGGVTAPNLTINDVSASEGNSGSTTYTFTVNLSSPAPTGGVTFNIATADSTATAGSDYTGKSLTSQTIPAGASSYTFSVAVNGDSSYESNEAFLVNVSGVTGANITDGQGIGTIVNDDSMPNLSINDVSLNEGNSGSSSYNFSVSLSAPAGQSGVTFNIATADGTATAGSDYTSNSLTSQTIPAGSSTYSFAVAVTGDTTVESSETFLVNVGTVSGATVTDGQATGTITNDDTASACSAVDTPIGQIQGTGATAALTGTQTVEGVVVGDYEGASPALSGFYLQNTAANADGNSATSDAIFIYNAGGNAVSLGQVVQVTGTVAENQGQTQLTTPTVVSCGSTDTITPANVVLPVPAAVGGVDYLERFEGMLVKFAQTLYVTEHFQLGRFGQVVMSSSSRLPQPTNITTPGAAALNQQAANSLNRIIVDDASQTQNPDPILFGRGGNTLAAANTLRGGDTATNMTGIMTYTWSGNAASGNAFRLRPINALNSGAPNFVAANPRAAVPAQVSGVLKVASANLLNFFNTFTNCTLGVGGAAATANCRGAENQTEFDRQWPKTVENLVGTGAAVIVVNEMENDGYGSTSAIQFLVDKMNAKAGAGSYAFINPDTTQGTNSLGTDAIKVGIIYKPGTVTPVGTTAVLNTGALGIYETSTGTTSRNRPALAKAFEENATGSRFIVVGNHLKSKGSACSDNVGLLSTTYSTTSVVADTDAGDGQGNCNRTRTAAAEELVSWLALNPTGTGDSDILIMGDLNSYAKEDPITAIKNDGYVNLIESHIGVSGYSYVFDGQWGYLDHALASPTLATQVQGVLEWHINADEPSVLDYNTNFKTAGQLTSLYAVDAFRTSDHDPIVIGLTLTGP